MGRVVRVPRGGIPTRTHIRNLNVKALAVLAVLGVVLAAGTTAVQADRGHDVVEAKVGTTFVVVEPFYFVNDVEFVSYVGPAHIDGEEYGFAWFTKGPPTPLFGNWVSFVDRWELYASPDVYELDPDTGALVSFTPGAPLIAGSERGIGTPDPWWFFAGGRISAANVDGIEPLEDVARGDWFYWIGTDPASVDLKIFTR